MQFKPLRQHPHADNARLGNHVKLFGHFFFFVLFFSQFFRLPACFSFFVDRPLESCTDPRRQSLGQAAGLRFYQELFDSVKRRTTPILAHYPEITPFLMSYETAGLYVTTDAIGLLS